VPKFCLRPADIIDPVWNLPNATLDKSGPIRPAVSSFAILSKPYLAITTRLRDVFYYEIAVRVHNHVALAVYHD